MRSMMLAAMGLMMGTGLGAPLEPYPAAPKRKPARDRSPLSVACPKCGAAVGEECDRRTLGSKWQHMARVKAIEEAGR